MDYGPLGRALLVLFMAIDLWGVFCGIDIVRFLYKAKRSAGVLQGFSEMGFYLSLAAACLFLMLTQVFVWPHLQANQDTPVWQQTAMVVFFFGASVFMALGLHRGRAWIQKGRAPADVAHVAR